MAFVSSLPVFYEMHFLYQVFIMLYTEDFSMYHYVRFLQIGSHNINVWWRRNLVNFSTEFDFEAFVEFLFMCFLQSVQYS